jgi:branched-chain amino acid transport system permease protein
LLPRLQKSDDPEIMSFLMMYGVSIALAAVMLLIFEADSRSIDYSFTPIAMKVGPIYVSTARIVAFGIVIVLAAALTWFLFRTLPGKALRATIMNPEAIKIVGVDVVKLSAFAFALASAIAGVTGVLGKDLKSAQAAAYAAAETISFEGAQFRRDIAAKAM